MQLDQIHIIVGLFGIVIALIIGYAKGHAAGLKEGTEVTLRKCGRIAGKQLMKAGMTGPFWKN